MNTRGVGDEDVGEINRRSHAENRRKKSRQSSLAYFHEAEIPGMLGRSPRECLAVYLFSRLAGGNLLDNAERNWRARKVY